jgi:hypothetical protein
LNQLQTIINQKILGDEFDPLHWEFPMTENNDGIESMTLMNTRAREIIVSNLEEIIELSIADSGRIEQTKFAVQK